jgi:hypothetical protein
MPCDVTETRRARVREPTSFGPYAMDTRKPIPPNPPRWQPNPNPSSINVPGLDKDASVTDQIEQIEQLITIKLQVRS